MSLVAPFYVDTVYLCVCVCFNYCTLCTISVYVIARQADSKDVTICRAMRGAECWTDHRFIRAKINLSIRLPVRKKPAQRRLNCKALQDPLKRESLELKLTDAALSCLLYTSPSPRD